MKKVEAIIRLEKLEDLKEALSFAGYATGMTVTQVLGFGNRKGVTEFVRGQEIVTSLLPKIQVMWIVKEEIVDNLVKLIIEVCRTGEVGDGKIFVMDVEEVIRIRTGEKGEQAI